MSKIDDLSERKEVGDMSERELLMELVEEKRRAEKRRPIVFITGIVLVLAVAILCAVCVPRFLDTVRRANEVMDSVQSLAAQAQSIFDEIQGIGPEKLAETVDNVNETAKEAREIMDELKEAGLDNLVQAVKDMSELADKLRSLFGR